MDLLLPHLGLIVWTLLAFLIVLFLLKKFAWGPILKGLNDRESSIADSLASAEKVKLEMAQIKNENEALLAKAREERAELLKEAKDMKDKIINEARDEAKLQAAKIINEAHASIQNQKMAALTDIKNHVGKMVIEVSEKILRRELADKSQQENYIKQLAEEIKLN
ncbi:MAG TPA: ATP synthase F0 subunit B [Chitinophagaceae bacterium]|nr:ATP synthase F0 subunit B [Chitinophagaceae bacterium]HCY90572.1 ATP synthase F0 subunit B [Chitinophagaceae bacterium]HRF25838.1 F0F1 ATP synthase subunit B [Ferruginibacter sp.]